jgi:hypothetical protein
MPQANKDSRKNILNAIKCSSLLSTVGVGITDRDSLIDLTGSEAERIGLTAFNVQSIDNQLDIRYANKFVDSFEYYNFNIS